MDSTSNPSAIIERQWRAESKSTTSTPSTRAKNVDVEAFYHTPRFHWGYEGDFFGLVHEATDIYGMDIWNAKAPESASSWQGKDKVEDSCTFVFGPEIYWGANPKGVFKYDFDLFGVRMDLHPFRGLQRARARAPMLRQATERESRQTTLYAAEREFARMAGSWNSAASCPRPRKVDEVFDYTDGEGNI